jgi:hypothetical protein
MAINRIGRARILHASLYVDYQKQLSSNEVALFV